MSDMKDPQQGKPQREKRGDASPQGARGGSNFIKPPTRPDFTAWEKTVQKKKEELDEIAKAIAECTEKLATKAVDPEREAFYEQQKKMNQRLKEVQATIREEQDKRSNITKSIRDYRVVREELEAKVNELTGQLGTFKSIEELEQALDFLTLKMETEGSGSLKQEKEYLRRRKLLEAAKDQISELKPLRQNIDNYSDKELESLKEAKELQNRLNELNSELRSVIQEKNSAVMPQSKVREEQAAARKQREVLKEARTKLRAEIDALYEERRTLLQAYQKKREAWVIEVEAAKKQAEEEAKLRAEERARRQEAAEVARRKNPYEKEIDMCQTLIRYLEEKNGLPAVRPATARRPVVVNPPVQVGQLLKKEEESDWLFQDRRKKKGSAGGAKNNSKAPESSNEVPSASATQLANANANRSIKHDIHRMNCFEQVGVRAPIIASAIPAAIVAIKEKLDHYRSFIQDPTAAAVNEASASPKEEPSA